VAGSCSTKASSAGRFFEEDIMVQVEATNRSRLTSLILLLSAVSE
jgi:hypothetical protein